MLHLRCLKFLNELLLSLFEFGDHFLILFFLSQLFLDSLFHRLLILLFLLLKASLPRLLRSFLPMNDLLLLLLVFQLLLLKLHLHLALFLLREIRLNLVKTYIFLLFEPRNRLLSVLTRFLNSLMFVLRHLLFQSLVLRFLLLQHCSLFLLQLLLLHLSFFVPVLCFLDI